MDDRCACSFTRKDGLLKLIEPCGFHFRMQEQADDLFYAALQWQNDPAAIGKLDVAIEAYRKWRNLRDNAYVAKGE